MRKINIQVEVVFKDADEGARFFSCAVSVADTDDPRPDDRPRYVFIQQFTGSAADVNDAERFIEAKLPDFIKEAVEQFTLSGLAVETRLKRHFTPEQIENADKHTGVPTFRKTIPRKVGRPRFNPREAEAAILKFRAENRRDPTRDEVADLLKCSVEAFGKALQRLRTNFPDFLRNAPQPDKTPD